MTQPHASTRARRTHRVLAITAALVLAVPLLGVSTLLPLLLLGMIDLEATLQSWVRPDPRVLGLEVSWGEPGSCQITITNLAASRAQGLRVRIVEDYEYADGGTEESELWLGDLAHGERRTVSYGKSPAVRGIDIGALKVWLTCDRGTAFAYNAWSYAF